MMRPRAGTRAGPFAVVETRQRVDFSPCRGALGRLVDGCREA
jgi:hypothetical protein